MGQTSTNLLVSPLRQSDGGFPELRWAPRKGQVISERAEGTGCYRAFVDADLLPTANHPPKLQRIFEDLLTRFNASALLVPDGSGRSLRLHLADQAGFRLAIGS
jgi:hypothetical protein